jgi:hypothetical protein
MGCKLHYKDAAHYQEEALLGSKQAKGKGKDKGSKGKGKGKDGAGLKEPGTVAASPKDAQPDSEEPKHAKCLLTMGLYPAPDLDKLKPYPKPALKADDAEMINSSSVKVQHLEASLEDAMAKGYSASIVSLLKKEITAAKTEQAKISKGGDVKGIAWEALVKRIANADAAAAAALERHKEHVSAVDEQILQLQKIREHRIVDFTAAQKAFAARRVEDLQLQAQMIAKTTVQATPEAMEETAPSPAALQQSVANAVHDLHRACAINASDLPLCTATTDARTVNSLASLWHFYEHVGLGGIPAVTFQDLAVPPHIAHTLMGDTIWESYWDVSSTNVTADQYIPNTMHNALRYVVNTKSQQLEAMAEARDAALAKLQAAKQAADTRRKAADPF